MVEKADVDAVLVVLGADRCDGSERVGDFAPAGAGHAVRVIDENDGVELAKEGVAGVGVGFVASAHSDSAGCRCTWGGSFGIELVGSPCCGVGVGCSIVDNAVCWWIVAVLSAFGGIAVYLRNMEFSFCANR